MDKITKIKNNLKSITETFKLFKESGIDEELLVVYIAYKMSIGKHTVKRMLEFQEEFVKKLVSDDVADKL